MSAPEPDGDRAAPAPEAPAAPETTERPAASEAPTVTEASAASEAPTVTEASSADEAPTATTAGSSADEAPTATTAGSSADEASTATEAPTVTQPTPASEPPVTPPATGATDAPKPTRGRRILVDAIIGVATILLVVGIFAVWANRLLFNPDNWSNTSTQLLANPTIRQTTSNYIVDQIYANVDVAGLIRSGLPTQLQGLADPVAGALRNAAVQGVNAALQRPRVQALWADANRAADQLFIHVVNGGKGAVTVNNGAVTLDLGSIVDNVAARLGLPADLSAKLPPNIAHLTVIQSDHLKTVQNVGKAIKGLALWLTILVPILYALAIFLARGRRRRTLMIVGFAGALGGILVILGRNILETQLTNAITNDASLRPTVAATLSIATQILSQTGAAVIAGGLVLAAAAWFGGPARPAVAARRSISPFLRERPGLSYAITLGIMVLIFIWNPIHATGTPAGIIVFTCLALFGTYVLIQETAKEFPDTRPGHAAAAIRERVETMRQRRDARHQHAHAAPSGTSTADQLSRLADLRDRDAITAEEYESAKSELLPHH